jgi:hypothetical protein
MKLIAECVVLLLAFIGTGTLLCCAVLLCGPWPEKKDDELKDS